MPIPHRAPDALVDFHTGNDALHDGVLTRDVHDLARWLFHAFAGPPPVERLAGRLRFEDRFQLIDLGLVFAQHGILRIFVDLGLVLDVLGPIRIP